MQGEQELAVAGLDGSLMRGVSEPQAVWLIVHGLGGTRDDRVVAALAAALKARGIGSYRPDLPPSMSLAADVAQLDKILAGLDASGLQVRGALSPSLYRGTRILNRFWGVHVSQIVSPTDWHQRSIDLPRTATFRHPDALADAESVRYHRPLEGRHVRNASPRHGAALIFTSRRCGASVSTQPHATEPIQRGADA